MLYSMLGGGGREFDILGQGLANNKESPHDPEDNVPSMLIEFVAQLVEP